MSTDVQVPADEVWALLLAISELEVFDSEFVDANGTPVVPSDDPDGRIHAHAVFYPGAGMLRTVSLDATPDVLDFNWQMTCVGGDRTRALWCVNKVRGGLTGKWITVAGQKLRITETPSGVPLRRDDDPKPPRFHVPLFFAVTSA